MKEFAKYIIVWQTWHRQTVDANEQASIQIWDEDQKGKRNFEYIDYLIAYVFYK